MHAKGVSLGHRRTLSCTGAEEMRIQPKTKPAGASAIMAIEVACVGGSEVNIHQPMTMLRPGGFVSPSLDACLHPPLPNTHNAEEDGDGEEDERGDDEHKGEGARHEEAHGGQQVGVHLGRLVGRRLGGLCVCVWFLGRRTALVGYGCGNTTLVMAFLPSVPPLPPLLDAAHFASGPILHANHYLRTVMPL